MKNTKHEKRTLERKRGNRILISSQTRLILTFAEKWRTSGVNVSEEDRTEVALRSQDHAQDHQEIEDLVTDHHKDEVDPLDQCKVDQEADPLNKEILGPRSHNNNEEGTT